MPAAVILTIWYGLNQRLFGVFILVVVFLGFFLGFGFHRFFGSLLLRSRFRTLRHLLILSHLRLHLFRYDTGAVDLGAHFPEA